MKRLNSIICEVLCCLAGGVNSVCMGEVVSCEGNVVVLQPGRVYTILFTSVDGMLFSSNVIMQITDYVNNTIV